MNPTHGDGDFCQWPVRSPYWDQRERSCGRPGHGRHVRLCWQHRDLANAEVIDSMYEHPDGHLSELLANWMRSTQPSEFDDEKQAEERSRSRRYAMNSLRSLVDYFGPDLTAMPNNIRDVIEPIAEWLLKERLTDTWGAA